MLFDENKPLTDSVLTYHQQYPHEHIDEIDLQIDIFSSKGMHS